MFKRKNIKNEPKIIKIGKGNKKSNWVRLSQIGVGKDDAMLTDYEKSLRSHARSFEKGESMNYHKKCIEETLKKKRALTNDEKRKIHKKTSFFDWINNDKF